MCLQVVAPTISSPVCQEQLIEAGKLVAKSVEGCVEASQGATNDEQLLKQVGVAATGVTQALNELLQHIKQYASGGQPIGRHGEATDRILDVTENIFSSMGDAGVMLEIIKLFHCTGLTQAQEVLKVFVVVNCSVILWPSVSFKVVYNCFENADQS